MNHVGSDRRLVCGACGRYGTVWSKTRGVRLCPDCDWSPAQVEDRRRSIAAAYKRHRASGLRRVWGRR